jgi:aminopeptidase C
MIHGIGVPVPETYRLPLPTAKQLWDMWFFGLRIKWEDRDRKIRPLRWFKPYNLKNKSDQKLLCKGRRVFITKLLDLAVTIGVIINAESVNQMNCNQSTTIFDAAFDCMLRAIEAAYFGAQIERLGDRRVGELQYIMI